jgi:hypothetical protein
MQSAFHNLPTINGVIQKDGREFCASNVRYTSDDEVALFSVDISRAYPPEAKAKGRALADEFSFRFRE